MNSMTMTLTMVSLQRMLTATYRRHRADSSPVPPRIADLAVGGIGAPGLVIIIAVELAIILSLSLSKPVLATYRLGHTPKDRVARTLSAWSIGQQASIAIFTALGGLLADITSPRTALTVTGLAILASPLLLPRGSDKHEVAVVYYGQSTMVSGR
jgi:hypothetical protein